MSDQLISHLEEKISKTKSTLKEELNTVRAGRANASLLDKIMVDLWFANTIEANVQRICSRPRTLMIAPLIPKAFQKLNVH
jgi:ribosome recycling factor